MHVRRPEASLKAWTGFAQESLSAVSAHMPCTTLDLQLVCSGCKLESICARRGCHALQSSLLSTTAAHTSRMQAQKGSGASTLQHVLHPMRA